MLSGLNRMKSSNTVWQPGAITTAMRENRNRHRGAVVWFTGLSGAGKSTLAHAVESRLFNMGINVAVLDGDNVRHGLCSDLGFQGNDRSENIRRVGEVAKLLSELGTVVLCAFISPFRADRRQVRKLLPDKYFEVYCKCQLEVCEKRDIKGLYKKARNGEIADFTGISSPYEEPESAEMIIDTDKVTAESAVEKILSFLIVHKII